jgi:hypothetical protein
VKKRKKEGEEASGDVPVDYDSQAAVEEEKNKVSEQDNDYDVQRRRSSSMSSEYSEEEDDEIHMDDSEIQAGLINQKEKK